MRKDEKVETGTEEEKDKDRSATINKKNIARTRPFVGYESICQYRDNNRVAGKASSKCDLLTEP